MMLSLHPFIGAHVRLPNPPILCQGAPFTSLPFQLPLVSSRCRCACRLSWREQGLFLIISYPVRRSTPPSYADQLSRHVQSSKRFKGRALRILILPNRASSPWRNSRLHVVVLKGTWGVWEALNLILHTSYGWLPIAHRYHLQPKLGRILEHLFGAVLMRKPSCFFPGHG